MLMHTRCRIAAIGFAGKDAEPLAVIASVQTIEQARTELNRAIAGGELSEAARRAAVRAVADIDACIAARPATAPAAVPR
ncbi:MAG: hypothetical protein FJZ92_13400 [Chloroflexi bacterium]|nr:hypothetical protein [Chloroflexota bacterium]